MKIIHEVNELTEELLDNPIIELSPNDRFISFSSSRDREIGIYDFEKRLVARRLTVMNEVATI
jgi:hypothetical protein